MTVMEPPSTQPFGASAGNLQHPPTARRARLYELDLFRLVAAIAVVLFHYTFAARRVGAPESVVTVTQYGHLGVQFFFMLSGFVILLGDTTRSAVVYMRDRIVRLYPTYWVAVALTGIVVMMSEPSRWWEVLVNATMLQQGLEVRPLDGSYWSLYIELKFYLLVAVVLHTKQMHRMDSILVGWAVLAAIELTVAPSAALNEVFLLKYAPFFITGSALALMFREDRWTAPRLTLVASCWAMALFQTPAENRQLEQAWGVEFSDAATMATLTMFFILMIAVARGGFASLRLPRFAILGAMSYPLYVLHQELGYQIFRRSPNHLGMIAIAVFVFMLVASYVVARFIEPKLARRLRTALEPDRTPA